MHQDKLGSFVFSISSFPPRFGVFQFLPLFHYPSWPIATSFSCFCFALNTFSLFSIVIKKKHKNWDTYTAT